MGQCVYSIRETDRDEELAWTESLVPEFNDTEKRYRARAAGLEIGCEVVNRSLR